MRAKCFAYLILLNLITLTIFGEVCNNIQNSSFTRPWSSELEPALGFKSPSRQSALEKIINGPVCESLHSVKCSLRRTFRRSTVLPAEYKSGLKSADRRETGLVSSLPHSALK